MHDCKYEIVDDSCKVMKVMDELNDDSVERRQLMILLMCKVDNDEGLEETTHLYILLQNIISSI